jgi:hypothetical protein
MELVMVRHVDQVLERALLPASPKAATQAIGYRTPPAVPPPAVAPSAVPPPAPGTVNRLG